MTREPRGKQKDGDLVMAVNPRRNGQQWPTVWSLELGKGREITSSRPCREPAALRAVASSMMNLNNGIPYKRRHVHGGDAPMRSRELVRGMLHNSRVGNKGVIVVTASRESRRRVSTPVVADGSKHRSKPCQTTST